MGVRIICEEDEDQACLYDSVTMWAFGPIFHGDDEAGKDAREAADHFLAWLARNKNRDARLYTDEEMGNVVSEWRSAPDQFGWEYTRDGKLVEVES